MVQRNKGKAENFNYLVIIITFFPKALGRGCCFLFQCLATVEKEGKSLVIIKEGLNLFSLKEIN